jgi:hypothetical protein
MKKSFLVLAIGAVFLFLIMHNVSANFACGRVNDYNSEIIQKAPGFHVKVYYASDDSKYIMCTVTSSDNKFCCDLEAIKGVEWGVGKNVKAQIFEDGYISNQVSMLTSTEGFDVFPELMLDKIIKVYSPADRVFIKSNLIRVNVSTAPGFNNIRYLLKKGNYTNETQICLGCNSADFYIDTREYGNYILEIIAQDDLGRQARESINITNLEYLFFDRKFECPGCRADFIPSNTRINITVTMNSSHYIQGVLSDYFPVFFSPEDEDNVADWSESSRRISWEVKGKDIQAKYTLLSPQSITPKSYTFQSGFEGVPSEARTVQVYFFRFFYYIAVAYSRIRIERDVFYRVSPDFPLTMKFDNSTVELISIFPKKEFNQASAKVYFKNENDFRVWSSIPNKDIDKILIRLRTDINSSSASLIELPKMSLINATIFKQDIYNHYDAYVYKKGEFTIKII